MHKTYTYKWLKHLDFIIFDLICLQVAYILAYALAGNGFHVYSNQLYINIGLILEATDVIYLFASETMKDVLKRGVYKEFILTIKHDMAVILVPIVVLFLTKLGHNFSRLTMLWTFVLYIFISYSVRIIWKRFLHRGMKLGASPVLFVISSSDIAEEVIENIKSHNYARYVINSMALVDKDQTGKKIGEVLVVAGPNEIVDYICQNHVDEVLIVLSNSYAYPDTLIEELIETGKTVHYSLNNVGNMPNKQLVEKVGNYTTITSCINSASIIDAFLKRILDIIGGLVGCLLTGIIFIFVAPLIYIASPGPIFFSQTRVGRNGKEFKMYKFRSMYPDAEKRKAELMKENRITDGKMFKVDFDPRIIGNKILPDGTKKTGIGEFIRKTSLDEFPQFFNVLKGDMSLVGTRPPLPSETALYDYNHHVRLAVKPGITGMWQVSGRSNITDFDEVVQLDKEYIENWSFGLDIEILIKTIFVVLKREGSM